MFNLIIAFNLEYLFGVYGMLFASLKNADHEIAEIWRFTILQFMCTKNNFIAANGMFINMILLQIQQLTGYMFCSISFQIDIWHTATK